MKKNGEKDSERINFHEGHRERVRKRILADPELKSFSPHEVLEFLLFYAVPRKDTNELAHKLIHAFGSLSAVFDADIEDLIAFPGLPENAAYLIKSILPITDAYLRDSKAENAALNTYSEVRYYVDHSGMSLDPKQEYVGAIFLDINGRVRNSAKISAGDGTSVTINIPVLYRLSAACKASKVIIFHNHPGDNMYPSMNDLAATCVVIITLASLGITVTDHIIRGDANRYFSFYMNDLLEDLIELCSPFINTEKYLSERRPLFNDDTANSVILNEADSAELKEEIRKMFSNEKIKSYMDDAIRRFEAERKEKKK